MTRNTIRKFRRTPALLVLAFPLAAGYAAAAEYWLCAKPTSLTMADGQTVAMWGFAEDSAGFAGNCAAAATVPGPALVVPPGDTSLTINLRNDLSGPGAEPVSIVIPGQLAAMVPVKFTDGQNRQRVRSFTAETAPGASQAYVWGNLKPGTYLYHSGTHPQVQVQMGLYGALRHDAAAGQAYPGVAYQSEATLLFSEIDPVLHAAVAAGTYGTASAPNSPGCLEGNDPSTPTKLTSTICYEPRYFLINGASHTAASLPMAVGNAGQSILLRLVNAGLKTRVPLLQGLDMSLVAEDGNPYPYSRQQYSAFLPALKTVDAIIQPTGAAASYPLYDRRLATINPGVGGSSAGGMLAFLAVAGGAAGTPVATADGYATGEDTPLSVAAPGVLGNDTGSGISAVLVGNVTHGSLSLAADGSFNYSPAANFYGNDGFSYRASSGSQTSATVTVSLSVTPVNDAPVAAGNAYSVPAGTTLNVAAPGVLGNDTDPDGDLLSAVNGSALAGLTLNPDGSFSYAATSAGSYSFTYQAQDPSLATSAAATVTITVLPNRPPVAVDDTVAAPVRRLSPPYTPVTIYPLANDSDPDGNLLPATVAITTQPNKGGSVTIIGNGTSNVSLSYTPKLNFRGTENFGYQVTDSLGATIYSGAKSTTDSRATVRVNVK